MSLLLALLACTVQPDTPEPPPPAPPIAEASAPERGADGLVEAPGVDLIRAHCGSCHSTALVLQNHMSRKRWDHTITWMQKTQGLWELPPAQRTIILDYLAAWQAAETQDPTSSPWASPLYEPNPIW